MPNAERMKVGNFIRIDIPSERCYSFLDMMLICLRLFNYLYNYGGGVNTFFFVGGQLLIMGS